MMIVILIRISKIMMIVVSMSDVFVHHNEYNEIDHGNGNNINFEITMRFSYSIATYGSS